MSADPRQIGSKPEKEKSRLDLSRSCPRKSGLLFLVFPSSTLDERLQCPDPHPTPPLSSLPSMFNDDFYPPAKDYVSQPLYVRQPCSLQIIQLVECTPPPPQQHKYSPSRLSSSSYSYSDSDSDASAYDSSSSSLSAGSSYCSSAEDSAPPVPPSFDNRDPSVDDTYHTRQRRVSLWRDAVCSKDVTSPGSSTSGSSIFVSRSRCVCGMFTKITGLPLTHSSSSSSSSSSLSRFSFPKAKNSRW